MAIGTTELDGRIKLWWGWFAMALFLLLPVDLFTTLVVVAQHGPGAEANPLMRWLIHQGVLELMVANLIALTLAVYLFDLVVGAVERSPGAYRGHFGQAISVWIALALVAGVVLTVNNIALIV